MASIISKTNPPSYGELAIARRKDKGVDLASADGDVGELQVDSAGNLRVTEEGGRPTYSATSQFACDSTGTDIWVFPGVAGVTAKILKIIVGSTATAAATGDISVIRRSAADTAGTSANASVAKADTAAAAASVQPIHYTAHPTALGATAGTIQGRRFVQQAAGTALVSEVVFDFTGRDGCQGLRVQGTSDLVAVNVSAALGGAGNAWDISVVWVEEPTTA